MNIARPFRVTAPGGKVRLVVMDALAGLPAAFALLGTMAATKVAVRIGGGCKGMSRSDKDQMLEFFSTAFAGYTGVAFSGGSRMVKDGEIDPMVTDIPGVLAANNPGAVALGTLPRVDLLTLQDDSRLVLDEYGNAPNPDMSGILVVQNGADGDIGWDGDVPVYFRLMENWRDYAGFSALGLAAWNGGAITEAEITGSIKRGWPTFLIEGSGRVTDEMITKLDAGEIESAPHIHIVSKENPNQLHDLLVVNGFLVKTTEQATA